MAPLITSSAAAQKPIIAQQLAHQSRPIIHNGRKVIVGAKSDAFK